MQHSSAQETTAIVPFIALAFGVFYFFSHLRLPWRHFTAVVSSADTHQSCTVSIARWIPVCPTTVLDPNSILISMREWCPLCVLFPRRGRNISLCFKRNGVTRWQNSAVQWCCKYSEVSMKKVALSALFSWNSNGFHKALGQRTN